MLTVNKMMPSGARLAPVLLKRAPTITLDWDVRQKSRFDATDSSGRSIGVFLPRGTVVRGGDVLVAEDGTLIRVDLTRAAYHLGNRHVPIELKPDHLKIEPDHVLADMLRAMHLIVREDTLAFEPEGGAYSAQGHGHGHSHSHGHAADHGDDHQQRGASAGHEVKAHEHEHEHEHEHASREDGHPHDGDTHNPKPHAH